MSFSAAYETHHNNLRCHSFLPSLHLRYFEILNLYFVKKKKIIGLIKSLNVSISLSLSLPFQATLWHGWLKLSLFINFNKTNDCDFV